MVDTAVSLLKDGDMETLLSALRELGARHAKYDVRQHMYPIVGEALVDTLKKALGTAWTPEVQKEWSGVVDVIFSTMITTW